MNNSVLDFKKRSVGNVPAPKLADCWCGSRNGSPCVCKRCDECGNLIGHTRSCTAGSTVSYSLPGTRADAELVDKLATSVERAAVVKYLRRMATETLVKDVAIKCLTVSYAIEKGEHVK